MKVIQAEKTVAGKTVKMETGKLAPMVSGSVRISLDHNVLLVTAEMGSSKAGMGYFPLMCDYQERFYAAGKIKGSRFIKREGRPSDEAVLFSRLIDRPIRPMFPKGITNEVQIIATALSADRKSDPAILGLTGASCALMLAGMPFEGPLAGVRVGLSESGEFILFPTFEEVKTGGLDLVIAGTEYAITMVEAGAQEIEDEKMLQAFEFAHEHIKALCELQREVYEQKEIMPKEYDTAEQPEGVEEQVAAKVTDADLESLYGLGKSEFYAALDVLNARIIEEFAAKIEAEEWSEGDIKDVIYGQIKKGMRKNVLESERRLDNRKLDEVRKIWCEVGMLPQTHGSGLFNRGETQILTLTTLGGPQDAQLIDSMGREEYEKRYIHHYNFPPYSVGEVRFLRSPGRREIGHGSLAERALLPVIPDAAEFPYTIMLVSETLACNGSSSMGSVCGSTLSLMDAGVPIKAPVSGIAMGLVMDETTGNYKILSDIQAQEDFLGDMDFKVTGTKKGITALQMDIKLKGLTIDLLRQVMQQSNAGRDFIQRGMDTAIATPRAELSPNAPLLLSMKIDPDMIRYVIGKGGETIQKISKDFNVEIDIKQEGDVTIVADSQENGKAVVELIKRLTYVPQVGDVIEGKVIKILDCGAIVELAPGKDGMVHISEIAHKRVERVSDEVKLGDVVKVKVKQVGDQGRISLSMKALIDR